jgi:uncharacterized protein YrzB (UPF0473 family)
MKTKDKLEKLLDLYEYLTEINDHTRAAVLLVDTFGTEDEKDEIGAIAVRHKKDGHISMRDSHRRFELSNKYYKIIKT